MMKQIKNYSILMSVYHKENPFFLKQAIESMLNQTVKSNDFVIVCDGKLTDELYNIIELYEQDERNNIHRLQLDRNYGLGIALNKGIKFCKNEIIARMDSDDLSIINRCELQLNMINDGYDIVGSLIDEFDENPNKCMKVRFVPEREEDIIKFAQSRNPFNHPSVMYRKTAVIKSKGYLDLHRAEDYYLWIRMILNNCRLYNIQQCLVHMRVNADAYKRKNTLKLFKSLYFLRNYQSKNNLISSHKKFALIIAQFVLTITPKLLLKKIYERLLRR